MITGFTHAVRRDELATVTATHARQAGTAARKGAFPVHESIGGAYEETVPYSALPFTRTEYYNADHGVRWRPYFYEDGVGRLTAGPTAYRPGRTTAERWNRAVHGPSLPVPRVTRDGDTITVADALFGDGAGHAGESAQATVETRLYREGVLVASLRGMNGGFPVPPDRATYRIEATGTRGAPYRLSTSVTASWTFTSARTTGVTPLPLSAVVFTPSVTDTGVARKGREFPIPIRVDGPTGTPRIEASFDDGRTWRPVPVRNGTAFVQHPNRSGFVSLRATLGTTTTHTVIRAYEIH